MDKVPSPGYKCVFQYFSSYTKLKSVFQLKYYIRELSIEQIKHLEISKNFIYPKLNQYLQTIK